MKEYGIDENGRRYLVVSCPTLPEDRYYLPDAPASIKTAEELADDAASLAEYESYFGC